jgi:hypothetical protein
MVCTRSVDCRIATDLAGALGCFPKGPIEIELGAVIFLQSGPKLPPVVFAARHVETLKSQGSIRGKEDGAILVLRVERALLQDPFRATALVYDGRANGDLPPL